jgi:hypothetical protein
MKNNTVNWSKAKALSRLGVRQVPFEPEGVGADLEAHGYSNWSTRTIAINPDSPHPGAAGFHELGHQKLSHSGFDGRSHVLHELEASAVCTLCLKALGLTRGLQESREHFMLNRRRWGLNRPLPANFKARVNRAAQEILDAGRMEEEKAA